MSANRFYFFMVLFLLIILGYLSYQIIQPFLTPIAWAIVFCVVFYPAYLFMLRQVKFQVVASLVILLLILLVIIGPFSYISYALINEISGFIDRSDADIKTLTTILTDERVANIIRKVQPYTGLEGPSGELIIENVKRFGKKIIDGLTSGFTNILGVATNFLIMAFTIFFLLKDGGEFMQKIRDYLPFSEQQKDRLTTQIKDMIVSTIYGGVIVAIIQGILGGVAFALLGIASAVFWGSVMSVVSFVPLLGTAIVWVPASFFLIVKGLYLKGIILVLIGIFVISMVDNVLKPLIIGERTKMPTILIFFTVLGGIKLFGLLGLVMGPLVFALFLSVFEMFRTIEEEMNH